MNKKILNICKATALTVVVVVVIVCALTILVFLIDRIHATDAKVITACCTAVFLPTLATIALIIDCSKEELKDKEHKG